MVKCCAPLCSNATYRKKPEITFHRFPKEQRLIKTWVNNIKKQNWLPSPSSVICSKHFEDKLIDRSGFRTVLLPGAIPTIFDSLQENIPTVSRENALINVHHVQPNTSTCTAFQQRDESPFAHERTGIKRSASGHHILQDINYLQAGTSVTQSQHTMSSLNTRKELVLRDIENEQHGKSSEVSNYVEQFRKKNKEEQEKKIKQKAVLKSKKIKALKQQNRRLKNKVKQKEEQVKHIKQKAVLKNKKIKALKQQNRRLKKEVSNFSEIISSLKEKLNQDEFHTMSGMDVNIKDFFNTLEKGLLLNRN